jgi:hypothetical protein
MKKTGFNLWDDYTNKYNLLSDKMAAANIKTEYLLDVLKSYEKLPIQLRQGLRHNGQDKIKI